jgi:hypothetical protein
VSNQKHFEVPWDSDTSLTGYLVDEIKFSVRHSFVAGSCKDMRLSPRLTEIMHIQHCSQSEQTNRSALIAWYPMDFRVPATCRLRGRFAEAPF